MNWRATCLLACWLPLATPVLGADPQGPGPDPVPSVMWAFYHKQLLGGAAFVFDDRVKLLAPPFAEDARQVPWRSTPGPLAARWYASLPGPSSTPCRASSISNRGSECCPGCRSASVSSRPRRCAPRC